MMFLSILCNFSSLISPFFLPCLIMNMLIWNCRGARNPNFYNNVSDMIRMHCPAIMIISETKLYGDRAQGIIDRLPLDKAIVANSFRHSGGLWLLWDSKQVELTELSSTEQEIHVIISSTANSPWLLSTIYTSLRLAERRLLWDNLKTMAGLHSLPWVIAGDFNEVLMNRDKFGGNAISISRALKFQDCLNVCNMIDIGFVGP